MPTFSLNKSSQKLGKEYTNWRNIGMLGDLFPWKILRMGADRLVVAQSGKNTGVRV